VSTHKYAVIETISSNKFLSFNYYIIMIKFLIKVLIHDTQNNEYCYKNTISKNKDVLAASKEAENATRPLKMEIENIVSVTICPLIIKITMFKSDLFYSYILINFKKFGYKIIKK